jgi:hypothetical protein
VSVYEKIAQLGITLPEVTPPVEAFVPFVRSGNQIFVSGHKESYRAAATSSCSKKRSARYRSELR